MFTMKQENGYWSVYSPGGARVLSDESYQVASNVVSAANGQPCGVGETDEVGRNTRRYHDCRTTH